MTEHKGSCTCTDCGRVLWVEDGPTCADCLIARALKDGKAKPKPAADVPVTKKARGGCCGSS